MQHKVDMQQKSLVVPFPVLFKDEKKYAEIVDVLDQLEKWVHQIYALAGKIPPEKDISNAHHVTLPSLPSTSQPDQPLSHVHPVADPNDPLAKVRVPCYGDQLTRVRIAGAKDLRAGCHTATDQISHIYPIKCADWHCKRSFLKLIFKKLYKNSGRATGTLRFFREKLHRRNVTRDVKHFEECEQLFLSVGRAYAVAAFLEFFGMSALDDSPSRNIPPYHVVQGNGDQKLYFDTILNKFVEEYLMPTTHDADSDEEPDDQQPDCIREYSICLVRFFFILEDLKRAVRMGDGDRLASLRKVLLKHFKSDAGYNVYAIEMFISILQDTVFLTEAQAHQTRWASLASLKGGLDHNMEIDLLQEVMNRELKKAIKAMGANKTPKSIERLSRAAGGTMALVKNLDLALGIKSKSSHHSHKSSLKDEKIIIDDLIELKPFEHIDNRQHESFEDASSDTLSTLDNNAFHDWLKRHKKNLLKRGPVDISSEDEDETI